MKKFQLTIFACLLLALQTTVQGIRVQSKTSSGYYGLKHARSGSLKRNQYACLFFLESQKYLSARTVRLQSQEYCSDPEDVWIVETHPYDTNYVYIKNKGNNYYIDIGTGGIYLTTNLGSKEGTRFTAYHSGSSRAVAMVSKRNRWLAVNGSDGSVTRTTNNSSWEAFIFIFVDI